jgi:glyoxylase-like metal-dependent hydrolase (beta-lactamase superfamily II)
MKLYVMDNGVAPDMPREALVSTGRPVDPNDVVSIPIETFLIDHPAGLVLFDTGWSSPERWPRQWSVPDEKLVLNRLSKIGVSPRDIRYVVCSHLHIDHAGGLEFFKSSDIIVSDTELTNVAKFYFLNQLSHPYVRADVEEWIRVGLRWKLIGDEGNIVEFLDGISLLSFGSGHSFGMLGLLVELPKTGNVVLTSDAIYCRENVGPPIRLPGVIRDPEGYKIISNRILQISVQYNAQLWYGHDMAQFSNLVKSDQGYYE